jgi:hypothetical protein
VLKQPVPQYSANNASNTNAVTNSAANFIPPARTRSTPAYPEQSNFNPLPKGSNSQQNNSSASSAVSANIKQSPVQQAEAKLPPSPSPINANPHAVNNSSPLPVIQQEAARILGAQPYNTNQPPAAANAANNNGASNNNSPNATAPGSPSSRNKNKKQGRNLQSQLNSNSPNSNSPSFHNRTSNNNNHTPPAAPVQNPNNVFNNINPARSANNPANPRPTVPTGIAPPIFPATANTPAALRGGAVPFPTAANPSIANVSPSLNALPTVAPPPNIQLAAANIPAAVNPSPATPAVPLPLVPAALQPFQAVNPNFLAALQQQAALNALGQGAQGLAPQHPFALAQAAAQQAAAAQQTQQAYWPLTMQNLSSYNQQAVAAVQAAGLDPRQPEALAMIHRHLLNFAIMHTQQMQNMHNAQHMILQQQAAIQVLAAQAQQQNKQSLPNHSQQPPRQNSNSGGTVASAGLNSPARLPNQTHIQPSQFNLQQAAQLAQAQQQQAAAVAAAQNRAIPTQPTANPPNNAAIPVIFRPAQSAAAGQSGAAMGSASAKPFVPGQYSAAKTDRPTNVPPLTQQVSTYKKQPRTNALAILDDAGNNILDEIQKEKEEKGPGTASPNINPANPPAAAIPTINEKEETKETPAAATPRASITAKAEEKPKETAVRAPVSHSAAAVTEAVKNAENNSPVEVSVTPVQSSASATSHANSNNGTVNNTATPPVTVVSEPSSSAAVANTLPAKKPLLSLTPQTTTSNANSPNLAAIPAHNLPRKSILSLSPQLPPSQPQQTTNSSDLEKNPLAAPADSATTSIIPPEQPKLTVNISSSAGTSTPPTQSTPSHATEQLNSLPVKPVLLPLAEGDRRTYSKDFLLNFQHITQKTTDFPKDLPVEVLADNALGIVGSMNKQQRTPQNQQGQRGGRQQAGTKQDYNQQNSGRGQQQQQQQRGGVNVNGSQHHPSHHQQGQGQDIRRQAQAQQVTPKSGRNNQQQGEIPQQGKMKRQQSGGSGRKGKNQQQQQQQQQPLTPVAPLVKSENRWEIGRGADSELESVKKKALALLNKLTLDKFDSMSDQLVSLIKQNVKLGPELLREIVVLIFDKALDETFFSAMYSDFCLKVSENVKEFEEEANKASNNNPAESNSAAELANPQPAAAKSKKSLFKTILLNKCQEEFERGVEAMDATNKSSDELADLQFAQKRRMLGNIKFIGELYMKGMLVEKIMHTCIVHLMGDINNPSEEDIEALCNLLTTIGSKLDHAKAQSHMDTYFNRLSEIGQNKEKLSSRIRFMIMDLIDLRKNDWVPRMKKQEAKSQDQVRKEQLEAETAANLARNAAKRGANIANKTGLMPAAGGQARNMAQDIRILTPPTRILGPNTAAAGLQPGGGNRNRLTSNSTLGPQSQSGLRPGLRPSNSDQSPRTDSPSRPNVSANFPAASVSSAVNPDAESVEKNASKVKSALIEFLSHRSVEEVKCTLEDFKSSAYNFLLISECVPIITVKGQNIDNYAKLHIDLATQKVLSFGDFIRGLERGTRSWEDELDEVAAAPQRLAELIAYWLNNELINFSHIQEGLAALANENNRATEILLHLINHLFTKFNWSEDKLKAALSFTLLKQFFDPGNQSANTIQSWLDEKAGIKAQLNHIYAASNKA